MNSAELNPESKKPRSSRIVELDALRALAAINLMLFHYTHVYSVKYGYSVPLGFEFPWGKYGVQLFFMLSGLVNVMTIFKKRDTGGFLVSRCLRIIPCYYIVLGLNLIFLCLMPLSITTQWTWPQLAANLTVMPNLFGYECLEPVLWTLQVEVLFYGMLIVLFANGLLNKPVPTVVIGLTVCVLGCVSIDRLSQQLPEESAILSVAVFARQFFLLDYFPLFAVGILLHDIWRRFQPGAAELPSIDNTYATVGSLLGIVASLMAFHCIDNHSHNPIVSIGLTLLLAASLFRRVPMLRWRPFVFVSGISYMLYLLHDNLGSVLIYFLNKTLGLPPLVAFGLVVPGTIALATLATMKLERPLTRALKQRWLPGSKALDGKGASVSTVPHGATS